MIINRKEFAKDKQTVAEIIEKYRELYNSDSFDVRVHCAMDYGILEYGEDYSLEDFENGKLSEAVFSDENDEEINFFDIENATYAQAMDVIEHLDQPDGMFLKILKRYLHHRIVYPGYAASALGKMKTSDLENERYLERAKTEIAECKKELNEIIKAANETLAVFEELERICDKYSE